MSAVLIEAFNRTRMHEEIERLTLPELVEFLDDSTRQMLRTEFLNDYLDESDRECFIFSLLAAHDGADRYDQAERLTRQWADFLTHRDIGVRYASEIERNWTEREGGE